jgi:hypothetical protein
MTNTRDLFGADHGAGKGDCDRSPGWREQYDTINWPKDNSGFRTVGGKQIKRYGQAEPQKHSTSTRFIIH